MNNEDWTYLLILETTEQLHKVVCYDKFYQRDLYPDKNAIAMRESIINWFTQHGVSKHKIHIIFDNNKKHIGVYLYDVICKYEAMYDQHIGKIVSYEFFWIRDPDIAMLFKLTFG